MLTRFCLNLWLREPRLRESNSPKWALHSQRDEGTRESGFWKTIRHLYRSWVRFPVQNRSWALYKSFVFPRYTKTVRCVMICPRFLYWGHFWFPPEELYKIAESFCSRPNCWKILDVASPKETMLQEIMMWLTFLYYTHCICIYKYREQHV